MVTFNNTGREMQTLRPGWASSESSSSPVYQRIFGFTLWKPWNHYSNTHRHIYTKWVFSRTYLAGENAAATVTKWGCIHDDYKLVILWSPDWLTSEGCVPSCRKIPVNTTEWLHKLLMNESALHWTVFTVAYSRTVSLMDSLTSPDGVGDMFLEDYKEIKQLWIITLIFTRTLKEKTN